MQDHTIVLLKILLLKHISIPHPLLNMPYIASSFIWKCTQKISITRANMCKLVEFLYYNDKLLFQTSRLYLYIPLVSLLISWKCTIHDKYMSWWVFVIKYCTTVIELTNMYFINLYRYFMMNTHRYNPGVVWWDLDFYTHL